MHQFVVHAQPLLELLRRHLLLHQQAEDAGVLAPAHPPDVEVHDLRGHRPLFDHLDDLGHHRRVHFGVEQHPAGVAQEPEGPDADQAGADQAHHRVEPVRAPELAAGEGDDGQHRGGRVGEHVQVGGTQVQVLVTVVVLVVVVVMVVAVVLVAVVMVRAVAQEKGADQVDHQAEGSEQDGLIVVDGHGREQPLHRVVEHQAGHGHQAEGTGVAAEHLDLPGAEGEAAVPGEPPGRGVGEQGKPQGQGMGTHVPAVGEQGHGVEQHTADDLGHHDHHGEQHGPAGVAFSRRVALVEHVRGRQGERRRARRRAHDRVSW